METKDWLQIGILIITAIIYGFILIANKKTYFSTTVSMCIKYYRDNFSNLNLADPIQRNKYMDLVNEEILYIRQGYIPDDIALDWIDGMLDYIPFFNQNNLDKKLLISKVAINVNDEIFIGYSKLKNCFSVKINNISVMQENLTENAREELKNIIVPEILLNCLNGHPIRRITFCLKQLFYNFKKSYLAIWNNLQMETDLS